jgi:hypothetical protein
MALRRFTISTMLIGLLACGPALASEPIVDNVVVNSFFDAAVTGWIVDPVQGPIQPYNHVSLSFDGARDAGADPASGSLQVQSEAQDANTLAGAAQQCVPIDDTRSYLYAGSILIPPGTPITLPFAARLEWRFYSDPLCESALAAWNLLGSRSSTTSTPNQWYDFVSSWLLPPNGAQSAHVRAEIATVSGGQYGQTAFANFDSITLVPEPGLVLGQIAAIAALAFTRPRQR